METIATVLFVWFWISCWIFSKLEAKISEREILIKKLNIYNNKISKENIELETSNKELLEVNFKLTKK